MNNFFITQAIAILLELLKNVIPADGSSRKKWKKALAKVFKEIGKVYAGDEEFQNLIK